MVTIEEGDEERSIVAPELRLRFTRLRDRWTHAIDIRPGPWQTLADAVEWDTAADDPTIVVSPTYQELHFQPDGEAVVALLVGQAGPHHFSASVRVTHRAWDQAPPHDRGYGYSKSLVEFDVADRCRGEVRALECNYLVHKPPIVSYLDETSEIEAAKLGAPVWTNVIGWETDTNNNYDVRVQGSGSRDFPTDVAYSERIPSGGWRVKVAPRAIIPRGTNRLRYSWSRARVMKRVVG